jgi:hypothetical protein
VRGELDVGVVKAAPLEQRLWRRNSSEVPLRRDCSVEVLRRGGGGERVVGGG